MKQLLFIFALALSLLGFTSSSYAVSEEAVKVADNGQQSAEEAKKKKGDDDEEPECD